MRKRKPEGTLRLGKESIRLLGAMDVVVAGRATCTAYTHSNVESECATRCADCP